MFLNDRLEWLQLFLFLIKPTYPVGSEGTTLSLGKEFTCFFHEKKKSLQKHFAAADRF